MVNKRTATQPKKQSQNAPRKEGASPAVLRRIELAAVGVLAALPFLHTLPYDFVYDDDFQVLRNPWIRDWSNLGHILSEGVWQFMNVGGTGNYYRPMHMLLHSVGYHISGLSPHGFHAINILLHSLCTVMVALIAFRFTAHRWVSLAAAALFALHPIHAESVTWIAAVTDPSCTLFYLAALYYYLKDEGNRRIHALLFMLCFLAALMCKEMAFTFPVVAVAADWLLYKRIRFSRIGMLAAVFAVYAAARIAALSHFMVRQTVFDLEPVARVLSTFVFLATYIAKLVVPYDICAFHVFSPTRTVLSPEFVFAAVVLGSFAAILWYFWRNRVLVFLLGLCVVTLAPVLNLQGVGENVFADRYLYLPTVGSSILIPLAARELWARRRAGNQSGMRIGAALLAVVLVVYGYVLWDTTKMWRDNRTLYTETLKRSPNATLIWNNLGQYYQSQGDYGRAIQAFETAARVFDQAYIQIPVNLASAYSGLGGAYLKQNNLQEAKRYFLRSREIVGEDAVVLDNLGSIYLAQGDFKTARQYYEGALARNPKLERIRNNLAALALNEGDYDKAISLAQTALAINPKVGEAYIIMGRAYARKGMVDQARESYRKALEVDPSKERLVRADLANLETSR